MSCPLVSRGNSFPVRLPVTLPMTPPAQGDDPCSTVFHSHVLFCLFTSFVYPGNRSCSRAGPMSYRYGGWHTVKTLGSRSKLNQQETDLLVAIDRRIKDICQCSKVRRCPGRRITPPLSHLLKLSPQCKAVVLVPWGSVGVSFLRSNSQPLQTACTSGWLC